MLLSFARKCDALPNRDDYGYVSGEVEAVWTLLREPVFAGLRGLAVVAVLEHLSLTFIPELGRRAEECGCEDFTYIQTHGEADVAHSIALIEAVRVEMGEGYQSAESIVQEAMRVAEDLVTNVFY